MLAQIFSLNHVQWFRENACKVSNLEVSPLDNARMGPVWSYYFDSGFCARTLGRKTKIVLVPTGSADVSQLTAAQRYKNFHRKYSSKLEFINESEKDIPLSANRH